MTDVHHKSYGLTIGYVILGFALTLLLTNRGLALQEHDRTPIELSGFSISEAYDIPDDRPLNLNAPYLKQLLYRIRNTSPQSRERYARFTRDLAWTDIATKTEDHRLWMFSLPARLKRVERREFKKSSSLEDVQHVYVGHCETVSLENKSDRSGTPFLTLARTLPGNLPVDTPLNESIHVVGFLYARVSGVDEDDNNEMPVFISDQIAWHPDSSSERASSSQKLLASHGVDIGLLDDVKEANTLPLGGRDAEAFYQLLAAVNRMDPNATGEATDPETQRLGFNELMQAASSNFGEPARIEGTIRSCSVINVPQQDIHDRLGVTQYYQLMVFPDLDGARVIVKNKDGSKIDYRRFPITVCCTELPEGMLPADVERQRCVVDGFFYRFWKYQSEKTDQLQTSGQVSPLIIAKRPVLIESDIDSLNTVLLVFVIGVIACILALFIGFRMNDRREKTPGAKILDTLPEKIDISGMVD